MAETMITKETKVTIKQIQQAVADYFGISIKHMTGRSREIKYARPRQLAMYLTRKLTKLSYPAIACHFGGLGHSTAIHAIKKIKHQMLSNKEIRAAVGRITEKITGQVEREDITKPTKTKNENSGIQPGIEEQLAEMNKRLKKIEKMMQQWE